MRFPWGVRYGFLAVLCHAHPCLAIPCAHDLPRNVLHQNLASPVTIAPPYRFQCFRRKVLKRAGFLTPRLHFPKESQLPPVLQRHLVVHLDHQFRFPPLWLFFHPFVNRHYLKVFPSGAVITKGLIQPVQYGTTIGLTQSRRFERA